MRGAFLIPALVTMALGCTDLVGEEPDRYLFDRASQVYKVFAEVRRRPAAPSPSRFAGRSLASVSPFFRDGRNMDSGPSDSLASRMRAAIRFGTVSPSDIQLPDSGSFGTQDTSNHSK